jgi:hypothetical protein
MKLQITLLLLFTITVSNSTAQTDTGTVYWLRFGNQLNFTPKIFWINEIDNRRFISPNEENQLIFHSMVHHKGTVWSYAGGMALSWAYSTKANDKVRHATNEIRPAAEVTYELPIRKWSLQQRIRLDNRFIEENKYETLSDGAIYVLRFRYRVQARIPLVFDERHQIKNSLKLSNEIMLNDRKNTFDQYRFSVLADHLINKSWSFEGGYIFIYQQRLGRTEFLERHVLRFSVNHKLFFY